MKAKPTILELRKLFAILIKFVYMYLLNKLSTFDPNKKWFKSVCVLFLVWLLTLPFGSNLFHISLGFFTVNPNLILTFLLFPLGISTLKRPYRIEVFGLLFLLLWMAFGSLFAFNLGFSKEVIFDLRSLIMQFMMASLLIGVYNFIGKSSFLKILVIGLRSFLFILLLSGIFEFLTGIHIAGYKTTELLSLPVGNIFYAPMFIYENPNDYLTHIIFVFLVLNVFDAHFRKNTVFKILIIFIIYIFTVFADSTIAKLICEGFLLFYTIQLIVVHLKKESNKVTLLSYLAATVFFVVTFVSKQLFLGPQFKSGANYRLNAISLYAEENKKVKLATAKESLNKSDQRKLIQYLDSINTESPNGSYNIRKNLFLNGVDFIRTAPILGIGPGGFALKMKQNKQKFYIDTQTSPHNFAIEIISQYGIFGWGYFIFIFIGFISLFQLYKSIDNKHKIALFLLFISMPLLWLIPSAFLYLQIQSLFLPLILIQLKMLRDKPNLDDI